MLTSILAIALAAGSAIAQSSSAAPAPSAAPAHTSAASSAAAPPASAKPPATSAVAPPPTAAGPPAAGDTVLTNKHYTYPNLPYQVDTDATGRGPQAGYNICNSTTAGPNSMCQTAWTNSISDFCLWGPQAPGSEIGDIEGSTVAWCTAGTHGTRVMPQGTITAVQFLIAPAYVQVTGLINQANIDMDPNDSGGELDPHGADERGNPLGGLMFSNAFGGQINQVIQWHSFMGSGQFCLKACNPNVPNSAQYCDNIYDRIGCTYNAPAAYEPGVFETCQSDNQDPPGVYTGADGAITTYHQPGEATPIDTLPYTAKIPATSSCVTVASASIFSGAPAASTTAAVSSGTAMTTMKAQTTAAAPSGSASGSASGAGSQVGELKLGGVVVVALGAIVGAIMVL